MGFLQKAGKFLGIEKAGKAIATATRVMTGQVAADREAQAQTGANAQKLLYVARNEKDPVKKKQLLEMAKSFGVTPTAEQIDPGLNLSNKEVIGSFANVGLNVALPGAMKGTKTAVIAKNAAMGAAFGAASGLEKNRSAGGVVGSTAGGAVLGAGVGAAGLMAKAAKDFVGKKVPEWMMNKAVRPALSELKKNVKYGSDTLGKELLDEGVKGGPKKLLEIADDKLTTLEDELQAVLNTPALSEARITKQQIAPYLKDLISSKASTPGVTGDANRVKAVFDSMPEALTLPQANEMKRRIYRELRDPAFRLDAKLGTKAQAMKLIAKGLKTEIETTVGGNVVGDINRKLSIYGRLEDSMVDQLAREMRNNGIGLTDAILLAGGDTTSILALLRHVGQGTSTQAAQALSKLKNVGTGPVGRATKSLLKRATLNAP